MKRYAFNLATVLRARRAQENIAQANLQRAHLSASTAELAAISSLAHYRELMDSSTDTFMVQYERRELAAKGVIGARASLSGARTVVAEAMNDYLAAARAVSVLERLDDRHREEHALALQKEEISLVDELMTSRHGSRVGHSGKKGRQ